MNSATHVYGYSMSVINNTSKPESVLQKKNIMVCFHMVYESKLMRQSLTTHIDGLENTPDLKTMVLYGEKRRYLVTSKHSSI